jgi:ribose transport system ATP-binding protein
VEQAVPELATSIRRLSKSFNGRAVLSEFDLDVAPGEVHALVGENGSGKSTLIKVLAGYHQPDDGGTIHIAGRELTTGSSHSSYVLGCRFVHQDLGLIEDLSVLDNMLLNSGYPTRFGSIRTKECRAEVARDLESADLSLRPDTLVRDLSPAIKTGVAVARALRPDPSSTARFLVLDEPTASLPDHEVHHLLRTVRAVAAGGVGVLYVTHRLNEIFEIADNVTVLRSGKRVATLPVAGVTRPELINLLVGREFEEISRAAEAMAHSAGREVLRVRHLTSGTVKDASFSVKSGELVGIAGITGSGAERLLAAVFGGLRRNLGSVSVDEHDLPPLRPDLSIAAGVAYMPPDRRVSGGFLDQSARENTTVTSLKSFRGRFGLQRKREVAEVRKWFGDLSVSPPDGLENLLSTFSGGNQQKILFAKWLRLKPSLFLLDEPTQGVDVGAKALLHHQLLEAASAGMSVVVQSSDVDELAVLCHRVIVIRDGTVAGDLRGSEVTVRNISGMALRTKHESAA